MLARNEALLEKLRVPVRLDQVESDLARGECRPWAKQVARIVKNDTRRPPEKQLRRAPREIRIAG